MIWMRAISIESVTECKTKKERWWLTRPRFHYFEHDSHLSYFTDRKINDADDIPNVRLFEDVFDRVTSNDDDLFLQRNDRSMKLRKLSMYRMSISISHSEYAASNSNSHSLETDKRIHAPHCIPIQTSLDNFFFFFFSLHSVINGLWCHIDRRITFQLRGTRCMIVHRWLMKCNRVSCCTNDH